MHITCGSTARLYCSNMWASQTAALVTICIIIGCISQPTSARVLSEMASDTLPEGAVAGGALSSDNDQDQAPQNAGAEGAPPAMVTARQAAPTPVYFPTVRHQHNRFWLLCGLPAKLLCSGSVACGKQLPCLPYCGSKCHWHASSAERRFAWPTRGSSCTPWCPCHRV